MQKTRWIISLMLLLLTHIINGQDTASHIHLLGQLDDALALGNPRALRDLASLTDDVQDKQQIIDILQQRTFFPPEQLALDSSLTRTRFFQFLNDYETKIKYSYVLNVFYTNDIESYETEFKILRKRNLSDRQKSVILARHIDLIQATSGDYIEVFIRNQLNEIGKLQSFESYDYLLGCLDGKNLPKDLLKMPYITAAICQALAHYDDPSVLQIILEKVKDGKIILEDAEDILSQFTNVKLKSNTPKNLAKQYTHLLDSLGSLYEVRMYGFEQLDDIRSYYFDEDVDYFAYLLCRHYDDDWIVHNTLRQIMATENPRALFYLAGLLFANSNESYDRLKEIEKQFSQYMDVSVQTRNEDGNWKALTDKIKGRTFYLNQVIYWATHYQDYEYDYDRKLFVNTELEEKNEMAATRLFRKLSSQNEEVALASFNELSYFPATMISKLFSKYQSVLRRTNPALPDFRYAYLENISKLRAFCEMENFEIQLSEKNQQLLQLLRTEIPLTQRYQVEEQLIHSLSINELTALEIKGLIYAKNLDFNFSVSKIIDGYYHKNFNTILKNEEQLRLYLKKSTLFSSVGVGGISNKYLQKMQIHKEKMKHKLIEITRKEYDEDIRDALANLLMEEDKEEDKPEKDFSLSSFLDNPSYYEEREIRQLSAPTTKNIKFIFKELQKKIDTKTALAYLNYLVLHENKKYTPHLMNALRDGRVFMEDDGTVHQLSEYAVAMLERIYKYKFVTEKNADFFPAAAWISFAKKHKDYRKWKQELFYLNLERFFNKEKVTIEEINLILNHKYCDKQTSEQTLSVLDKLENKSHIRKLKPPHLLSVPNLKYFKNLGFKDKYLDNVLELFKIESKDSSIVLNFVSDYMKDYSSEEKGYLYTRLSKVDDFFSLLLELPIDERIQISKEMKFYLNHTDFISSYEEKNILSYIFKLLYHDKNIIQQLEIAKNYLQDIEQVYTLQQEILMGAKYNELADILQHAEHLVHSKSASELSFLEQKLGLPSYLFESNLARKKLEQDIRQLSPSELYKKYLNQVGVNLFLANGKLNFPAIREVLEFDIINPFSSTISKNRTHLTHGVLGLLTSFFPDFSSTLSKDKNIKTQTLKWISFLENKGYVEKKKYPLSLNRSQEKE